MKNKLPIFIDKIFILYSLFALIYSGYLFFRLEVKLTIIPYVIESVLYLILRVLYQKSIKKIIVRYTQINTALILTHTLLSIFTNRFILEEYFSLFNGLIIISTIYATYIVLINGEKTLKISLGIYIFCLLLFILTFRSVFEEYSKINWINTCSHADKTQSKQERINNTDYCECVYNRFLKRYEKVDNFPSQTSYSREDKIDIFNCTVDFLIPDSINKDSLKKNIENYIDED